ncbi:hypothetical protein TcWFU_001695 [Taenia crassiceps]|uniref:Type II toxin-antitoxin system PemK/MazF family toxin n=1 Tax=Taenia crassiceps TaxID=6207 RepID=A0ABR4PZG0_9CEST
MEEPKKNGNYVFIIEVQSEHLGRGDRWVVTVDVKQEGSPCRNVPTRVEITSVLPAARPVTAIRRDQSVFSAIPSRVSAPADLGLKAESVIFVEKVIGISPSADPVNAMERLRNVIKLPLLG